MVGRCVQLWVGLHLSTGVRGAPTVGLCLAPRCCTQHAPSCPFGRPGKPDFHHILMLSHFPATTKRSISCKAGLYGRALLVQQHWGPEGGGLPYLLVPKGGSITVSKSHCIPAGLGEGDWRGIFSLAFQMRCQGPERVSDLPEATQLELRGAQPHPGPGSQLQVVLGSAGSR